MEPWLIGALLIALVIIGSIAWWYVFPSESRKLPKSKALYKTGVTHAVTEHHPDVIAAYKKAMDNQWYEETIEACKKAIAIEPEDSEAYFHMGQAYAKLKRNEKAIFADKKAIAIWNGYLAAYISMGQAHNSLGQYEAAIVACKKAISIKPDYAEAYLCIGQAYCSNKQYENAISALKTAISLKPHSGLAILAEPLKLQCIDEIEKRGTNDDEI
jgi:tetratricopeptide (TPR) repeat protein